MDKLLTGTGFAYAPIALFALGKDRARLLPVAIQCGQDPATHPMFVRPAESESDLYWGCLLYTSKGVEGLLQQFRRLVVAGHVDRHLGPIGLRGGDRQEWPAPLARPDRLGQFVGLGEQHDDHPQRADAQQRADGQAEPVSYTHLDVYKRQTLAWPRKAGLRDR